MFEESIDFGFFFARVMSFYSIPDEKLFEMPIKRFWLLSGNVDRIEAQRAIRNLTVANAAQGDPQGCRDNLISELGTIYIGVPERDEEGIKGLKQLSMGL